MRMYRLPVPQGPGRIPAGAVINSVALECLRVKGQGPEKWPYPRIGGSGTAYPPEALLVWSLDAADICTPLARSYAKLSCDWNFWQPSLARDGDVCSLAHRQEYSDCHHSGLPGNLRVHHHPSPVGVKVSSLLMGSSSSPGVCTQGFP